MSRDEDLHFLVSLRDRLRTVLADIASDRVSREYSNSEIADFHQEVDRLDREIAALKGRRKP